MEEHKRTPSDLREEEALLKYISEIGINPAEGVPTEILDQFLKTERSRAQFASFFDEAAAASRLSSLRAKERLAVFLHPRFHDMPNDKSDQHKIKILLAGQMPLDLDGHRLMLEPGDICFIAPGVEFSRPTLDQKTLLLNIIFNDHPKNILHQIFASKNPISMFYGLTEAPRLRTPYLLCRTGDDPEVRDVLNIIYDYKAEQIRESSGERVAEVMVEQLLLMLLARHMDHFSDSRKTNTRGQEIQDVLEYINENAVDLSLPVLAQYFNYSESYMSRFIKRHTGRSFSELQQNARLDMAADLLRSTDLSVSNIITEVGYTGKAHFYRVFHERFGITPAEMREKFRPGNG